MSAVHSSATAQGGFATTPNSKDPYKYQVGFGSRFASEAVPGALPHGQNNPQKCAFDLFAEQLSGTAFTAPRSENQHAWLYRIRPSVANQGFSKLPDNPDLESNFMTTNPKVHVNTGPITWNPFEIPLGGNITFVDSIKTLAGNGDPTLREGLAVHMYMANASMEKKAFANNDGDMLIVPQQGRLDIQTEYGQCVWSFTKLTPSYLKASIMVRPAEICVIQRGVRFKVTLPDGPSRGYIQELFGSRYELPELGPIGANGLANPRDFEHPIASFDVDQSPWEITCKLQGKLFVCKQSHTPFDVVAWHGNYIPYKYDLERFSSIGSISKDHTDPSVYCVLTAKSKYPGVPLADFLLFSARWDVASGTFRPPYYHRNCATEFLGCIYGDYITTAAALLPGGGNYHNGFTPHGVPYKEFKGASEMDLKPMYISQGHMVFMMESGFQWNLSEYAMNGSGKMQEPVVGIWDNMKGEFLDRIDDVDHELEKAGVPRLSKKAE